MAVYTVYTNGADNGFYGFGNPANNYSLVTQDVTPVQTQDFVGIWVYMRLTVANVDSIFRAVVISSGNTHVTRGSNVRITTQAADGWVYFPFGTTVTVPAGQLMRFGIEQQIKTGAGQPAAGVTANTAVTVAMPDGTGNITFAATCNAGVNNSYGSTVQSGGLKIGLQKETVTNPRTTYTAASGTIPTGSGAIGAANETVTRRVTIDKPIMLTAVRSYQWNAPAYTAKAVVYRASDNTLIAEGAFDRPSASFEYIRHAFTTPVVLPAGTYYIGLCGGAEGARTGGTSAWGTTDRNITVGGVKFTYPYASSMMTRAGTAAPAFTTVGDNTAVQYGFDFIENFKTQIGTFKVQTSSGTTILPIYDPSTLSSAMRISTSNGIGCFELVNTTDPNASPLRVQTSAGTKAISK